MLKQTLAYSENTLEDKSIRNGQPKCHLKPNLRPIKK